MIAELDREKKKFRMQAKFDHEKDYRDAGTATRIQIDASSNGKTKMTVGNRRFIMVGKAIAVKVDGGRIQARLEKWDMKDTARGQGVCGDIRKLFCNHIRWPRRSNGGEGRTGR